MDNSKEHIEAQLAAYIDGELSESERIEIERHLARHPHHRQLIQELSRTRALIQSLPRVQAPIELNDSLVGQLERSALLDPQADQHSDVVLRINRWPQFAAVAAVILLALGLGIVVYYVLPPGGPAANSGPLARNTTPSADKTFGLDVSLGVAAKSENRDSVTESQRPSGDGERRKEVDRFRADALTLNAALTKPSIAENLEKIDERSKGMALAGLESKDHTPALGKALDRTDLANGTSVANSRDVEQLIRERLLQADRKALEPGSLYMVVSTADVAQADQQISRYLTSNSITYMERERESVYFDRQARQLADREMLAKKQSAGALSMGRAGVPADGAAKDAGAKLEVNRTTSSGVAKENIAAANRLADEAKGARGANTAAPTAPATTKIAAEGAAQPPAPAVDAPTAAAKPTNVAQADPANAVANQPGGYKSDQKQLSDAPVAAKPGAGEPLAMRYRSGGDAGGGAGQGGTHLAEQTGTQNHMAYAQRRGNAINDAAKGDLNAPAPELKKAESESVIVLAKARMSRRQLEALTVQLSEKPGQMARVIDPGENESLGYKRFKPDDIRESGLERQTPASRVWAHQQRQPADKYDADQHWENEAGPAKAKAATSPATQSGKFGRHGEKAGTTVLGGVAATTAPAAALKQTAVEDAIDVVIILDPAPADVSRLKASKLAPSADDFNINRPLPPTSVPAENTGKSEAKQ